MVVSLTTAAAVGLHMETGVETALEPLRRRGLKVLFYLDDRLLLARSRKGAALQKVALVIIL